jgi:tRNA(Ile2) C34 agmatinyltransferase TiaS
MNAQEILNEVVIDMENIKMNENPKCQCGNRMIPQIDSNGIKYWVCDFCGPETV